MGLHIARDTKDVYSLTRTSEVRFRGQTGKHLLTLSLTAFDPQQTSAG